MTARDSNPWTIAAISSPRLQWAAVRGGHEHRCAFCGIALLSGETAGFCCGQAGKRLNDVPPLPPLPPEYDTFIHHPNVSAMSRSLNLVFSFASLETTAQFPEIRGPPGFLAIQGKVYHR
ncbi:hypothetical protein B0H21DRAFT_690258, partial [Amylocystis lapponica]